jgi:hypothetical protein
MSDPKFRQINQMLGSRPSLGPIPADLVLPWGGIGLLMLVLTRSVFGLDWYWTLGLTVWGCATWTALTGRHPHKFLAKFLVPPRRWARGHERYRPLTRRKH